MELMVTHSDTLSCNAARLAHWQQNSAYNYNRELQTPDFNVYTWIKMHVERLLNKVFGRGFADEYADPVLIIIFVVIVLALIWFVYRKHPGLFTRAGKKTLPYSIAGDTIYGVDFRSETYAALARKDYKEAIRFLYLQTLRTLSDQGAIDWQLYKTPMQYVYEVKPETRRSPFRKLTNCFMRVRYGNFDAEQQLFDEMKVLHDEVEKGDAS